MEPRNAIGDYDRNDDKMVLYTSSQGVHGLKRQLAANIFKVPDAKVRVVTREARGGFGMKLLPYPGQPPVLVAAQKVGDRTSAVSGRGVGAGGDTGGHGMITKKNH